MTLTASWQKIFSDSPRIGFLAQVHALENAIGAGRIPAANLAQTQTTIFNARLDAAVCLVLATLVLVIVFDSVRLWTKTLRGTASQPMEETPFIPTALRRGTV